MISHPLNSCNIFALQQEGQSRKKKKLLVLEDPVDRGKLKMKDLIHMNPKSNPMK